MGTLVGLEPLRLKWSRSGKFETQIQAKKRRGERPAFTRGAFDLFTRRRQM